MGLWLGVFQVLGADEALLMARLSAELGLQPLDPAVEQVALAHVGCEQDGHTCSTHDIGLIPRAAGGSSPVQHLQCQVSVLIPHGCWPGVRQHVGHLG